MASTGSVLWRVVPGGVSSLTSVVLYDHTWEHIKGRHPEVEPLFDELKKTIENPTAIYKSATDPDGSLVFFNEDVKDSKGQALSLPVRKDTESFVVTCCYRKVNYSGVQLWKK